MAGLFAIASVALCITGVVACACAQMSKRKKRAKVVFEFQGGDNPARGKSGKSGKGGLTKSGQAYWMTRNSMTTFPLEAHMARRQVK